jgi:hypothetical protein
MRRREFIKLLGGTAAARRRAARGQSAGMLGVGMVDAQQRSTPTYAAFLQRLAELGSSSSLLLKTAAAIGIATSTALLLRADKVIE